MVASGVPGLAYSRVKTPDSKEKLTIFAVRLKNFFSCLRPYFWKFNRKLIKFKSLSVYTN
ncbi:hypothetical protein TRIP_E230074 [uncultured Spirochaetota bacterium]|nr:hypothetical protein TRIP_E230074 [uncultured Spirochaetota bacterium]